jgi:hypothetical protein
MDTAGGNCGVNDTAEAAPAVSLTPLVHRLCRKLREFEAICKTVLTRYQGPKWDCLMKKTIGQKFHDTVPLRALLTSKSDNGFKRI